MLVGLVMLTHAVPDETHPLEVQETSISKVAKFGHTLSSVASQKPTPTLRLVPTFREKRNCEYVVQDCLSSYCQGCQQKTSKQAAIKKQRIWYCTRFDMTRVPYFKASPPNNKKRSDE